FVHVIGQQAARVQRELFRDHSGSARRDELGLVVERVAEAVGEALLIQPVAELIRQRDLDPDEVAGNLRRESLKDLLRHVVPMPTTASTLSIGRAGSSMKDQLPS